jgi:hypothetical protein
MVANAVQWPHAEQPPNHQLVGSRCNMHSHSAGQPCCCSCNPAASRHASHGTPPFPGPVMLEDPAQPCSAPCVYEHRAQPQHPLLPQSDPMRSSCSCHSGAGWPHRQEPCALHHTTSWLGVVGRQAQAWAIPALLLLVSLLPLHPGASARRRGSSHNPRAALLQPLLPALPRCRHTHPAPCIPSPASQRASCGAIPGHNHMPGKSSPYAPQAAFDQATAEPGPAVPRVTCHHPDALHAVVRDAGPWAAPDPWGSSGGRSRPLCLP